MSTLANVITAEQLLALPDDGNRYELVKGLLQMMSPAGARHGRVTMRIGSLLEQHVHANDLGAVYAAETGFLISRDPDTVRAPDVAFVGNERLGSIGDGEGYVPTAPDLAVEVVSPGDSFTHVEAKARMWLEAGTAIVLVVDPATRIVRIYRTKDSINVLGESDELDASDVVADWKPVVGEFFN